MIELAGVIRDLREELEEAIVTGADAALRFELGPVELEVSVVVQRGVGTGAKVRFWVVELGADARADATSVQKMKLTLTPRLSGTGATPYVAGQAVPGEK